MPIAGLGDEERRALERAVQLHRVVYEVSRARRIVGAEPRDIGFDVTLSGTHRPGAAHPVPGCVECQAVWSALRGIASAATPPPNRRSGYEIEGFDRAIHMDPGRGFRKDVELVLTIRHEEDYLGPIDACEETCVADIRRELEALGVREKRWD